MSSKNVISSSLSESFQLVWNNKSYFVVLAIIQAAYLISIFVVSSTYLPAMLDNAQAMSEYISSNNLDEASMAERVLQQQEILEGTESITRYFEGVVSSFRAYAIYLFILASIFSSILWSAAHKLVRKLDFRQSAANFYSVFIIVLFYLGLMFLFFYSLLNIRFADVAFEGSRLLIKYIPFLIASVILSYFMFISISLANRQGSLVQKTLKVGLRKMHYVLAAYLLDILFFLIFILLAVYFIDRNLPFYFFISMLSLMLFIFSLVLSRIFMIKVFNKLEEI